MKDNSMTTFKAITDVLCHLSEDELRELNKLCVSEIKYRRKLETISIARTVRLGDKFILKNIRPRHLEGQEVEVTAVRNSKVTVKSTKTGHTLGIVPMSCLEPVAA